MNAGAARNALLALAGLALAGSCATSETDAIARLEAAPPPTSFSPALVERGARLTALGDCQGCHTAEDGRAFAGGRPVETPFGTIYSTNITPEPRTGIGLWSEQAFRRALREGLDRGGRHLYPAFPYDRFTLASDEDIRAIYAFLMTRPPVSAPPPRNRIPFPFNVRSFLAVWNALYLHPGPWKNDPAHDARWNRGGELAEGLGHCSSCHTPRNALGAERGDRHFEGGDTEGWHAYAIGATSQSPVGWTEPAMRKYLRDGWEAQHGVARGPMAAVSRGLVHADEGDLAAIAHYVVSGMGHAGGGGARKESAASANAQGERLYRDACAQCHEGDESLPFGGLVLAQSIGVAGESPRNLVNMILYGLPAAGDGTAPIMPGFAGAMSDAQVVALSSYLRARFTNRPPWPDLESVVAKARKEGERVAKTPAGGAGLDPARWGGT
ncbi:MAG TPA: cytochrome c [Usitatibacter sp.]|nr:cytochrome c [Usitatibacter sp.]